ncbi:MAG: hybrid sensor histidine kinase/response regulator [Campylobacterales bacterium]|nr:hybrid sensor histidine kinase/response regulator [Campylobacterales bacterium]
MHKPLILVVDDEPIYVDFIVNALHDTYLVKVAYDGKSALDILKAFPVDLILLDIQLPNLNGYEIAKKIIENEQTKEIPFIFLTSDKSTNALIKGFKSGAKDYITKPFDLNELLMRINNQLTIVQLKRQLEQQLYLQQQTINQQYDQLINSEKYAQIGSMMNNILHQWKQPLNAISLVCALAETKHKTQGQFILEEKQINRVKDQIEYMTQTIESFKNFFNPHQDLSVFYFDDVYNKVNILLEHRLKKESIKINTHFKYHHPIKGMVNHLIQVILNIFNNSCDAFVQNHIENKTLWISTVSLNNTMVIKIKDNAGGIDPSLLPDKLFENYITTKENSGTGIGLQLCQKIIHDSFGGQIKAYNENNGAVFEITLVNI